MKTFDVTIDHILDHFVGSKLGLYVSFLIPLYLLKEGIFKLMSTVYYLVFKKIPTYLLSIMHLTKTMSFFFFFAD